MRAFSSPRSNWRLSVLVLMACSRVGFLQAATSVAAAENQLVLEVAVRICNQVSRFSVQLAVEDLMRDLESVLETAPEIHEANNAQILIALDRTLTEPEACRIETDARRILIRGADELGVVYGLYRFSREFLGADPYWY